MSAAKNIQLVVDAVNVVLKNLGQVKDNAEGRTLEELGFAYIQQAEGWKDHPPAVEQREALMRKVLALHIAASRIRRPRGG
jgi:hypothetical protein